MQSRVRLMLQTLPDPEHSYVLGAENHVCWGKAAIIQELEAPTPLSWKLALAPAACSNFGQMVRQALRGTSGALAGIWSKDAAAKPHRCHCRALARARCGTPESAVRPSPTFESRKNREGRKLR